MVGWRTVIVQNHSKLSEYQGQLRITTENGESVLPLSQLQQVWIETGSCTLSSAILTQMAEENVALVFCDKKHNPIGEVTTLSGTVERAGKIIDQSRWIPEQKNTLWEQIAKQKIRCQMQALSLCEKSIPDKMIACEERLTLDDPACCEGQAAGIYFHAMFGMTFNREQDTDINAGLNYGYSILLSMMNRIIRSHGYITELGIHHCSRTNPFNFSCDLMEPFRPIVDLAVYRHNAPLTKEFRLQLIQLLQSPILYKKKQWKVQDAMEAYCLDAVSVLNGKREKMGGLQLAG